MKNKNMIFFIVIGFILTTAIWGFVGGCGTSHISWRKGHEVAPSSKTSAKGLVLKKTDTANTPVSGEIYIVEAGDTLWGISKRFGVSMSSIKDVNKLQADTISVGQRLIIPGLLKSQVTQTTQIPSPKAETIVPEGPKPKAIPKPGLSVYKVRKDDSLWRIAQIYGTTIERIAELNGLPKDAKLVPGQEILVPGEE